MKPLCRGDLKILPTSSHEGDTICLAWTGRSGERHPSSFLGPYFAELLETAAARRCPIELRFERLEHLNSSTITALIKFLQESSSRGLRVLLTYDESVEWQRISFDALGVFAADDGLVILRPAPPEAVA